jgi:NADH-quinone oxidoreductase subunit J
MTLVFYLSVAVAVLAALLMVTRQDVVHALLYLVVTLLATALAFFALGASFAAALEVILYAGATMVLFVFAIMTLNTRPHTQASDSQGAMVKAWVGPALLCLGLLAELVYAMATQPADVTSRQAVDPEQVGLALLGPYLLGTELASMLLTAGVVGAYHLGHPSQSQTASSPEDRPSATGADETLVSAAAAPHTGGPR